MTWARLDDGWPRHPKMVAAGKDGRALWICGLCYCAANLTDGKIPKGVVPIIAAEADVRRTAAVKLVEVGTWVDQGDEYEVHDYLDYNPSREKVLAEREAAAERQRRGRESQRMSREKSQRDIRRSNGVSSGVTSVVPTPTPKEESSTNSRGERPRDALWDAFAEEVGHQPATQSERGKWNKGLKDLRGAGATAEQVRERCEAHRAKWPGATLSLTSLAAHWGELAGEPTDNGWMDRSEPTP